MKRKFLLLTAMLLLSLPALFCDEIEFNGGISRIVLKEGKENVVLSQGAYVKVDSLRIVADEMNLSGSGWTTIRCTGNVVVEDDERDLSIRSTSLYYDRNSELLLISSYFELEDRGNELSASASHLEYDMADETLTLTGRVSMSKLDNGDIVRIGAEKVEYDRTTDRLSMKGGAEVTYKGDEYYAEVVVLDLEKEEISLDGKIRGTING